MTATWSTAWPTRTRSRRRCSSPARDLTREDLIDAVNEKGAQLSGPGLVPFRYSKTEHGGYSGVEMGQVRNGKIVLFGGPLVTEPTAGSPITPYTGAQPAPPASGVSVP